MITPMTRKMPRAVCQSLPGFPMIAWPQVPPREASSRMFTSSGLKKASMPSKATANTTRPSQRFHRSQNMMSLRSQYVTDTPITANMRSNVPSPSVSSSLSQKTNRRTPTKTSQRNRNARIEAEGEVPSLFPVLPLPIRLAWLYAQVLPSALFLFGPNVAQHPHTSIASSVAEVSPLPSYRGMVSFLPATKGS